MKGQTAEETQVVGEPFAVDGFPFQTDDASVALDVGGKGQVDAPDRMIDNAIDEEGGIRHEFTHPRRIRSVSDDPLQEVGFSDAFQKGVKVVMVGDETGFVQVPSAAKQEE